MVEQTNLYAVQVLRDKTETSWTNVTEGDIYVFLGIAVLMGVNQLHALAHYWWKNPIFHYSPIADRISRDRFLATWQFLQCADNTTQPDHSDPEYDRLFKVCLVISAVNRACQQNYHGSQHQSIDEAMVGFKRRCSMKQYMPKKPIEASKLGSGRQFQWVCLPISMLHWERREHHRSGSRWECGDHPNHRAGG